MLVAGLAGIGCLVGFGWRGDIIGSLRECFSVVVDSRAPSRWIGHQRRDRPMLNRKPAITPGQVEGSVTRRIGQLYLLLSAFH